MRSKGRSLAKFAIMFFLAFPTAAFASLTGGQVEGCLRLNFDAPEGCTPVFGNTLFGGTPADAPVARIDDGVEFQYVNSGTQASANFTNDDLFFTVNAGQGALYWGFRGLEWRDTEGSLVDGTIDVLFTSWFPGFVEALSYTYDSQGLDGIFFRTRDISFFSSARTGLFVLEFVESTTVPLPPAVLLLGSGIAALMLRRAVERRVSR